MKFNTIAKSDLSDRSLPFSSNGIPGSNKRLKFLSVLSPAHLHHSISTVSPAPSVNLFNNCPGHA